MLRKLGIAGAVGGALLFFTSTAAAAPRTHDGFFFRAGLNLGLTSATAKAGGGEVNYSGMGLGYDLMFGGTPIDGLVIGGALLVSTTGNPTVEFGGTEVEADGTMLMAGTTLFGNYYLDPTEGLHFQGQIGYGALDFVSSSGQSGGNDPTGLLFGIGVGYDIWLSDSWSFGPFGRVMFGSMSAEAGGVTSDVSYLYPSIGIVFTAH